MEEEMLSSSEQPFRKGEVPENETIDASDEIRPTLTLNGTETGSFTALRQNIEQEQRKEKSRTSDKTLATFQMSQNPPPYYLLSEAASTITDWQQERNRVDSAESLNSVVTTVMNSPGDYVKVSQLKELEAYKCNLPEILQNAAGAEKTADQSSEENKSRISTRGENQTGDVSKAESKENLRVDGIRPMVSQPTEDRQQTQTNSNVEHFSLPISTAAYIVLKCEMGRSSNKDSKDKHQIEPREQHNDGAENHPRFPGVSATSSKNAAHQADRSNPIEGKVSNKGTDDNLRASQCVTRGTRAETKLSLGFEPKKVKSVTNLLLTGGYIIYESRPKEHQSTNVNGAALMRSHTLRESILEEPVPANCADEQHSQEESSQASGDSLEISKPDTVATDLPTIVLDEIEDPDLSTAKRKLPFNDSKPATHGKRKCTAQTSPSLPSSVGTTSTSEHLSSRTTPIPTKKRSCDSTVTATRSPNMNLSPESNRTSQLRALLLRQTETQVDNSTKGGKEEVWKGGIISRNVTVINSVLGTDFTESSSLDDINGIILKGMPRSPHRLNKEQPNPPWLLTSRDTLNYHCWPCLLLSGQHWSVPTDAEASKMAEEVKCHECTSSHISANVNFVIAETIAKTEIVKHERNKRKTQRLLRILTRIICFNRKNINNQDECAQLVNLACNNVAELKQFASESPTSFLKDFVKTNAPLILEAIERSIMSKIKEQVNESPFVALMLEEMSDVVDKSSIATLLRYVAKDGTPIERLVKMSKSGLGDRTAAYLLKIAFPVIEEYDLKDKLVGFTYNGTAIHPKEMRIFNKTMKRVCPKSRFFHYQEHNFKRLMTQSLTHIPRCRDFFYTVGELAEFIKNNPKAKNRLIVIHKMNSEKKEIPWDFADDFIATIKNRYDSFMEFFTQVLVEDEGGWEVDVVAQVEYFWGFFRSRKSQMMLWVAAGILEAVDKLSDAMGGKVDWENWEALSKETKATLGRMKKSGIQAVLQRSPTTALNEGSLEFATFTELFNQLIEAASFVVTDRTSCEHFNGLPRLELIHQDEHLASYLRRINEPHCLGKLKIQARLCHFHPSFANKTFREWVKNIHQSNVADSLREIHKMLRFRLTVPSKDTESPEAIPAISRLRSYYSAKKKPVQFLELLIHMEEDIATTIEPEKINIVQQCIGNVET